MTTERIIRAVAGSLVLASLVFGYFVHPGWFLFTAFVGVNLLQSAFTKWCLMEEILRKSGVPTEVEWAGLSGASRCGRV